VYKKVVTFEELLMEITVRAPSKEYSREIVVEILRAAQEYYYIISLGELLLALKVRVKKLPKLKRIFKSLHIF
jgi:hypothetical protein